MINERLSNDDFDEVAAELDRIEHELQTETGSASPLTALGEGGRHAGLGVLTSRLHAILVGRAAQKILDRDNLPEECSLWVPPSYVWLTPRLSAGRKTRGADGLVLRLPHRLEWTAVVDVVPVVAARPRPVRRGWVTRSMGHTGAGATAVLPDRSAFDPEVTTTTSGLPVMARLPVLDRDAAVAALTVLVEEGKAAEWEFRSRMEPIASRMIHMAHRSLRHEFAEYTGTDYPLFDETRIEELVTAFVYGSDDHPGKLTQCLDRMLDPETSVKVDPQRYMNVNLMRDAKDTLRSQLGDPRKGPAIRSVSKELSTTDAAVVLEEFRRRHPDVAMSIQRVRTALSVCPDPMATYRPL